MAATLVAFTSIWLGLLGGLLSPGDEISGGIGDGVGGMVWGEILIGCVSPVIGSGSLSGAWGSYSDSTCAFSSGLYQPLAV